MCTASGLKRFHVSPSVCAHDQRSHGRGELERSARRFHQGPHSAQQRWGGGDGLGVQCLGGERLAFVRLRVSDGAHLPPSKKQKTA